MPEISQRGIQMPESPIRKLAPFAEAAKAEGIRVYHLNIGQPDLPSPASALEAIRNINRTTLEYSPSDGYRYYRENLVGYYKKFNINLTPDEIIITAGGSEAVLYAFMACLNPGDEIIVHEPAYANYMAFATSAGAIIRTVPSEMETGFALPPIEEFEKIINERTKGILICNPNNPTGYVYSPEEMEKIYGTKVLVLNALQNSAHISHFNLTQALEMVREIRPGKTYLTHISHKLGTHRDVEKNLPEDVFLAYDGLTLSL